MTDAPPLLVFAVPGRPVPKGRPRVGRGRGYTPARTRAAEDVVRLWARRSWVGPPTALPLAVTVVVWLMPGRLGDVDNFAKLVLDAMQGTVMVDDRQVRRLLAERLDAPTPSGERTGVVVRAYVPPIDPPVPPAVQTEWDPL